MLKATLICAGLALSLAGCIGNSHFTTSYDQIDRSTASNWRTVGLSFEASDSLTVSEANRYLPAADIVWHGDPPGDRRAQIEAIFFAAMKEGSSELKGRQPVTLAVNLQRFHALTPKARSMSGNVGVHNIQFTLQVFDARTGLPLTDPISVSADIAALVGADAANADARGYTQKVEIRQHLTRVFRNLLGGYGEDPRSEFARAGG